MKSHRLIAALLAALLVSACSRNATVAPATTAAAPNPDPTPLAAGPRIVSTVPAATLNLVLMGAADRLVGVSKYDTLYLPMDRKNLPVVGDYQTINYEQLVKLKPTVLIIQTLPSRIEPKLTQVAAEQHMELLNMRFDHVADIWTSVDALGKAADMEKEATLAIHSAQAELSNIAMQYKDSPHPRVVYVMTPNSILVCGGNNFIDETITAAGGVNAGAAVGNNFVDSSRETIVTLAPEVLLIGAAGEPDEIANDPRLAQWLSLPVPAARSKRVYLVTDGDSQMASLDIGKKVRALADMIHKGDAAPVKAGAEGKP